MIFLSFEQLGNQTNVYVEPTVPANPPATVDTPQPDVGVHLFAEINASMSRVTGVPVTDSTVAALYASEEQSLPAVPQINAFTASEQAAISQLAGAYCSELVSNPSYQAQLNTLFPGISASLSTQASLFFTGASAEDDVSVPLANALVGINGDPAYAALQNEVNSLLARVPGLSSGATVAVATRAACQAALGSAALTLK